MKCEHCDRDATHVLYRYPMLDADDHDLMDTQDQTSVCLRCAHNAVRRGEVDGYARLSNSRILA